MTQWLFLIQMAGRSGVGKSTLANLIAQRTGAVIIDYDIVKTAALEAGCSWDLAGAVGYGASRAIANSLLAQGTSVILDSPCRFQQIIDEGTAIATKNKAVFAFIECVHHDDAEVKRRLESRPRLRSQKRSIDVPAPDAPNLDPSEPNLSISTKYPKSAWVQIETSQAPEKCLSDAVTYLEKLLSHSQA